MLVGGYLGSIEDTWGVQAMVLVLGMGVWDWELGSEFRDWGYRALRLEFGDPKLQNRITASYPKIMAAQAVIEASRAV